ncbi:hypothetical protein RQP46_002720 [Phenoliferia psychrophenolica]
MKKAKIETIVISDSEDEERSPAVSGSGAGAGARGPSNEPVAKRLRKRVPATKKPTKRGGASMPAAARPAGLPFPPEVLINIISEVSCANGSDPASPEHHTKRNALLAPLTRVSRQFQAATYSVLYGDLRVAWEPTTVDLLARSCTQNHALLTLPRRLEATAIKAIDRGEWIEQYVDKDWDSQERQLVYFEERYSADEVEEYWDGALPDGIMDEYRQELLDEAEAEWSDDMATNKWSHRPDTLGIQELLDLMEHTTNLQSLVIHGFSLDNPTSADPFDFDDLNGLESYPSITSLATPDDFPLTLGNPSLAAWLRKRMPRLRRLTGLLPLESPTTQPPTPLPLLTHLDLFGGNISKSTLNIILEPIRDSLVSLRLRGEGWQGFGTVGLLRLERLALEVDLSYSDDSQVDLTLPECPLRHLELSIHSTPIIVVPVAVLAMLATLPSTLETLVLKDTQLVILLDDYLKQILYAVKKSQARPLCVISMGPMFEGGALMRVLARWVVKFEAEELELRVVIEEQ